MTSRRLLKPEARLLLDAADYIEEHGWCQHHSEEETGEVCLLGAMLCVRHGVGDYIDAVDKLRNHLRVLTPAFWNDAPGRTKEEVVAALRGAAVS